VRSLHPQAAATRSRLRRALPKNEWTAVSAWLSTFYPFQLEWLLDWSKLSLLLKCRQIGASHTYAGAACLWGLLGEHTSVISLGERESADVLRKVARHAEALCRLGSRWAKTAGSATRLTFASGGSVSALPSTSAGRGTTGNIILDEAAYYERSEEVFDAASAATMHGYRLRVASTPNGVGNLFHRLVTDERANRGYTKHIVTLEQAIADGLHVDVAHCHAMARHDPRVFAQLFECKFLDNDQQYIPSELIDAACVDDIYAPEGDVFAGLDVGRTADRTVLVVVRVDPAGVAWVLAVETKRRTSAEDLDQLVALAVSHYRAKRVCVDSTGIGAFPAEQLQKRFGRQRIEPVSFTLQSKEDLATTLYQRFTEHTLKLPAANTQLRDDVAQIRRVITTAGNVRYDAKATADGHADSAWALALSLHAAARPGARRTEILNHRPYDDDGS
jgi:phage FluMu gp28-like protein